MEPLKPQEIQRAKAAGVTDEELAEYMRLLAERFSINPALAKSPTQEKAEKSREQRIGDLFQKIFSPA